LRFWVNEGTTSNLDQEERQKDSEACPKPETESNEHVDEEVADDELDQIDLVVLVYWMVDLDG